MRNYVWENTDKEADTPALLSNPSSSFIFTPYPLSPQPSPFLSPLPNSDQGVGVGSKSIQNLPGREYLWRSIAKVVFVLRTKHHCSKSIKNIYAPVAHIMYLTVVSWSNKFCNGEERPEQGEQVPLCTCSSTPLSMGPKTPSRALVHKTTYASMIYTAPVHNVLDVCISITWASGRGLGPGPQMTHDLSARCHFTGPPS